MGGMDFGGGGGMNPAGMMMGMAMGGAMAQQMTGMMNSMSQPVQPQVQQAPQMPGTPPPMPTATQYMVAINGQQYGPYNMQQMQQMQNMYMQGQPQVYVQPQYQQVYNDDRIERG